MDGQHSLNYFQKRPPPKKKKRVRPTDRADDSNFIGSRGFAGDADVTCDFQLVGLV